ncbi:hypothetical protein [Paenibacillus sp. UNC499MF]|uniref:hypothetical protein n=1 Tax=Paenibacillus sp. UNC499MF TaxID=1502751 RepID=UPI0011B00D97|nr:hypothetical protein [Paenibacillus sp. UNC499MF]
MIGNFVGIRQEADFLFCGDTFCGGTEDPGNRCLETAAFAVTRPRLSVRSPCDPHGGFFYVYVHGKKMLSIPKNPHPVRISYETAPKKRKRNKAEKGNGRPEMFASLF